MLDILLAAKFLGFFDSNQPRQRGVSEETLRNAVAVEIKHQEKLKEVARKSEEKNREIESKIEGYLAASEVRNIRGGLREVICNLDSQEVSQVLAFLSSTVEELKGLQEDTLDAVFSGKLVVTNYTRRQPRNDYGVLALCGAEPLKLAEYQFRCCSDRIQSELCDYKEIFTPVRDPFAGPYDISIPREFSGYVGGTPFVEFKLSLRCGRRDILGQDIEFTISHILCRDFKVGYLINTVSNLLTCVETIKSSSLTKPDTREG